MISKKTFNKIKSINALIGKLNESDSESNSFTFKAIEEHVKEIKFLFSENDLHWSQETIDLLIYCLLLLDRNNYSLEEINGIINHRCQKFKEKILKQISKKV